MRVYFLRHGPAGADMWSGPDEDRPLTDDGRGLVESVCARLAAVGVTAEAVLTSPYARALQTAEIAADRLGVRDRLEEDPRLASGFGMRELRAILSEHATSEALLLVGHEPDFSETVGALIGGGAVKLKKAGLARVDVPDPAVAKGVLVWLAQPALLRT